jgi:hypothetical protein
MNSINSLDKLKKLSLANYSKKSELEYARIALILQKFKFHRNQNDQNLSHKLYKPNNKHFHSKNKKIKLKLLKETFN